MGEKDEGEKKQTKSVTIVTTEKENMKMEEGKQQTSSTFMPKLPKPLTIEEKKYLLAVERADISTVRKMLQKSHRRPDYIDKDCVDPLGRGALDMSIDNENLEMVEMLVVMGVETKDALLHAIDVEFVEAVEVLLEHEELIYQEDDLYSWEKVDRHTASFTPEITPLILAAHRDNYEILKILLDRGAMLPMPHDIRCGCPDCIRSSAEDSLRHSMSRINSYKALASPSLIALSSTDPILTAFELSWELKTLAYSEQEFKAQYLELRRQCRDFAEELLSHTRSSTELAVILNYDPDSVPYEDGEHMNLRRLELAIDYKQKKFVAHANVQQLLAALWYEGLPGFRRKEASERLCEIMKVAVLFPFYCMHYMLMPESPTGKLMRTPFMKFLIHSASYLFFLLLLILVSVRFEDLVVEIFGTEGMLKRLEEARSRQRGNLPSLLEFCVFTFVFGFVWEEVQEMKNQGLGKYFRNMWNILDIMRDFLYVSTIVLRMGAFTQQQLQISKDPHTAYIPREEWATFDPQLISEGLFSAANILSALKLVHIFSINPKLGPLQISLGRMVIDIVKFFFIYSLVLFAFACGLTQLLWYYNDLEKQKCYSLPGGLPDWTKQGDACMKWRRFHNLFEASQSLFWAGFGMVGLSDFELTGIREYTRFWSMLMFGSYSVINIIVLLNLLIAMMSNSYSFIVEHADTEWKFARTKLWMSYFEEGKTLPPPFNIFPNIKWFRKIVSDGEDRKLRRMSTRTQRNKKKDRDFRYLGVMRALIWRYVCSRQRKNIESPVTEDDINEVKGDISALRFELVDLFGHNGMDVSACAKKSKAAMGRKMKIWERRLMRDFHVSPAMGAEETSKPAEDSAEATHTKAADRFKKLAKLATTPKMADIACTITSDTASQIGRTTQRDDKGRESLKRAMDTARRKMEESTPDGSENSSRSCSPYPDLYAGPSLLDAIENLDLSPFTSGANTPLPPDRDGQAKDKGLLVIRGRRSEKSLDKGKTAGELSISVPSDVFSISALKKLSSIKKEETPATTEKEETSEKVDSSKKENKVEQNENKNLPAALSTISETGHKPMQIKKDTDKTQSKASAIPVSNESLNKMEDMSKKQEAIKKLLPAKKDDRTVVTSQPSQPQDKSNTTQFKPKEIVSKPTLYKSENMKDIQFRKSSEIPSSIIRPRPQGVGPIKVEQRARPVVRSFNQPLDQVELQNTDIVRKPRMPLNQVTQKQVKEVASPETNSNSDNGTEISPSAKILQHKTVKSENNVTASQITDVTSTTNISSITNKQGDKSTLHHQIKPQKSTEEDLNAVNLKRKEHPKREAPLPTSEVQKQKDEDKNDEIIVRRRGDKPREPPINEPTKEKEQMEEKKAIKEIKENKPIESVEEKSPKENSNAADQKTIPKEKKNESNEDKKPAPGKTGKPGWL